MANFYGSLVFGVKKIYPLNVRKTYRCFMVLSSCHDGPLHISLVSRGALWTPVTAPQPSLLHWDWLPLLLCWCKSEATRCSLQRPCGKHMAVQVLNSSSGLSSLSANPHGLALPQKPSGATRNRAINRHLFSPVQRRRKQGPECYTQFPGSSGYCFSFGCFLSFGFRSVPMAIPNVHSHPEIQ